MSQQLVIAFRPLHTCMVNLPMRWVSALSASNKAYMVFKLSWNDRSAFVAWSGGVSRSSDKERDRAGKLAEGSVLEIDGTFGNKLGLADGIHVAVEYQSDVRVCTMAEVVPDHFDDWEILELNAGAVESRLLHQTRVVAPNQPLVFWLNPSTSVTLHTTSVVPTVTDACALLDNDTEVVVAPKVRKSNVASQPKVDGNSFGRGLPRISCLRVAADADAQGVGFGVVYVHPESTVARQLDNGGSKPKIVRIGHSTQPAAEPNGDGDDSREPSPAWFASLETSADVQPGVLLASQPSLVSAGFAPGELVRIEALHPPDPSSKPNGVAVGPVQLKFVSGQPEVTGDDVRLAIRKLLSGGRVVLSAGMSIPNPDSPELPPLAKLVGFQATESAENSTAGGPLCLTKEILDTAEIDCTIEASPFRTATESSTATRTADAELAGIDEFLQDAWHSVDCALMSRRESHGSGVLICGRRGSGKTSILRYLQKHVELSYRRRLVYCRYVDCTRLTMDPRTNATKEAIQKIAHEVLLHQPSLLILDDLDTLVPAETEQMDTRRVAQMANTLTAVLDTGDGRRVTVVATTSGRAQLNGRLFTSGMFQRVLEIPPPGKSEREQVLASIGQSNDTRADTADVNFSVLSYLTEGYMPADLHELYERAVHEATMRVLDESAEDHQDVRVKHVDLVRAHADFKPMSLRGVKLQTSETRWADIGGLEDTRRQLRETLELPTRYAAIFATSPLRLRSGVLLFGYPGCGKTLLASAIARECGLNFIATKGPELLSKYIGSSEQSVRDLFKRAVAASPCVLFFDEFESIAPRRGHDNTGVTDRVVNQFLTEMDGAEGLKGVYVLAATSRPDLIDPALLRPGRLDKAFLCGMPGLEDRADILKRQAHKIKTADDEIDWRGVAERTEGFTGADLQALVYNAFLESVHEATAQSEDTAVVDYDVPAENLAEFTVIASSSEAALSSAERTKMAERLFHLLAHRSPEDPAGGPQEAEAAADLVPVVTMAHLERALELTQSSLGEQDRQRFEAIYRDFVDDKKGAPTKPVEQRATLA
ncbi:Peroxisome biosynthesis protein pex1 [Coemansia sp. RSA 552]|nr:Peroxisome biosynthesis protein pex1 [Coemansia sp. RSA 552]